MDPPYSVEEREKQISLLRELRARRRQGQELKPKSLVQAAKEGTTLSKRDLRAMLETEYKSPVVSLYLPLKPETVAPSEKDLARALRSAKTRAVEERKDFIEALPRPRRELLTYDLKEIETFLEEYLVPKEIQTLVIFKSGDELNRVFGLPVHMREILTIDPDPFILPLEATLEEQERVLFLEVTKEASRFAVYHLGSFQEVDQIRSFVPSDRVDKSIPGHAQQHRLTHLQAHLKATAQRAYHLFADQACDALVVMGEDRVLHLLDGFLHESLKAKTISRIDSSPVADPRDRKDLINQALRSHKVKHEIDAIERLNESNPRELVCGLPAVIDALNLFMVRDLIVGEGLERPGYICREHHYITLEGTQCPFCNKDLLPVENLIDEIVEIARLHGVKLTIVEHRQELLSRFGGIAATVYWQQSEETTAA
jgi:hypothetical protein